MKRALAVLVVFGTLAGLFIGASYDMGFQETLSILMWLAIVFGVPTVGGLVFLWSFSVLGDWICPNNGSN